MAYKPFNIFLDTKEQKGNASFILNTNDLNTPKLIIKVTQDKEPVILNGATVRLAIKKPDGLIVFIDGTVTNGPEGECEFVLTTQAYVMGGKSYYAELMIYYAADQVAVTGAFGYEVRKGIMNDDALESTNEFQLLYQSTIDAEAAALHATTQGDYGKAQGDHAKTQGDYAKQVADENKTRFLAAVATVSDRDTNYPSPVHGDTVRVTGEAKSYRFVTGSGWVVTDEYNPTAIDEVNAELAKNANQTSKANRTTLKLRRGLTSHRGLQGIAPENTIKAISEAGRRGFVLVEIDPQLTSDGTMVLIHDPTVDRTTDGTGTVTLMTLAEIKSLKIDSPVGLIATDEVYRVPTLDEALKEIAYWGMGVNIDGSKFAVNSANVTQIYGLIKKYGLTEKSWIVGPTYADRQVIKSFAPDIAVGWTTTVSNIDNDLLEAKQYTNALLAVSSATLTDAVIEKCNKDGVFIMAYTANDLKSAYKWLNRGVSFVETDFVIPGSVV